MQTILTYLMLLLTAIGLNAQNTIEVSITRFSNNDGKVRVGLYNQESQWLNTTYVSVSSEIVNQEVQVTFNDIPDGTYAISCFHDEDSNGKLNMTMGVIPSESYGCSNGAKGFFGPPKWEDATFEVRAGEVRKIDIKL